MQITLIHFGVRGICRCIVGVYDTFTFQLWSWAIAVGWHRWLCSLSVPSSMNIWWVGHIRDLFGVFVKGLFDIFDGLSNGLFKQYHLTLFFPSFFEIKQVSVPLKTFKIWAFIGMMGQIPLSHFSRYMEKRFGERWGNMVVWASIILGQPLCIMMYYHDYVVTHYNDVIQSSWSIEQINCLSPLTHRHCPARNLAAIQENIQLFLSMFLSSI